MNAVAALKTNVVFEVFEPTRDAFTKLLEAHRAEIQQWPQQTFRFGSTDRHQLDVYYPDPNVLPIGSKSIPVLFFIYGGAFVMGDRKFAPPFDLCYTNLGTFFAKRGILTVIPDYRLTPHVQYPEPVKDVRDALLWFLANTASVISSSNGLLSPDAKIDDNIFIMGHSAGANAETTLFLSPSLLPLDSPLHAATRGLIPQGGWLHYDLDTDDSAEIIRGYYGSDESTYANMPIALLKKAPEEVVQALPPVFVLRAEREQDPFIVGNDAFVKELEARLGKGVKYEIMKRHNHISPHLALMTSEGEEWAEDVVGWIRANQKV